jgi:hypothetical protein
MTATWDPTEQAADEPERAWPEWPRSLSGADRAQGCLALELIEHWPHWVKRRVEKVELVGPATSRHRISIDFRLRNWFPSEPFPMSGSDHIYVPLTRLAKYPILNLDIRDETGRALPLVTRRKSAAIAAGALSILAARIIKEMIDDHAGESGQSSTLEAQHARDIDVPDSLERYFYALAYADPEHPARGLPDAGTLAEEFVVRAPPGAVTEPTGWSWTYEQPGVWRADATDRAWREALARHTRFFELLRDVADLFLVCIPIECKPAARRIVKLSYQQHIEIPQMRATINMRRRLGDRLRGWYSDLKDALEGLPSNVDWGRRGFRPHAASPRGAGRGISWFAKVPQAVGWMPKPVFFDAPAASQGGTYHFEFEAPPGLQIRQASLTASAPDKSERRVTAMGAQSLRRVQLYLGDLPQSSWGRVSVHLKVAPNTLVRGAWFATWVSTLLLFVYFWKLEALVDPAQNNLGSTLAALLLVPGLVAGMLTRGEEHPITTDLLFGLRCLCGLAAGCPAAGAVLLVAAREWDWLEEAWAVVLAVNTVLLFVLSVTWLLAARRRPDGSMP